MRTRTLFVSSLLSLLHLTLASPVTTTQDVYPILNPLNNTGNGCGPSGLHSQISTNLLTHTLAHFTPHFGPDAPDRLNCELYAYMYFSEPGYAVVSNVDSGKLSAWLGEVGEGEKVVFTAAYEWVGSGTLRTNNAEFRGPLIGRAEKSLPTGDDASQVSPCGGGLLRIRYQSRAVAEGEKLDERDLVKRQFGDDKWIIGTGLQLVECGEGI